MTLKPSPEYRELVYKSSKLDITKDLKARFALTLWYEGPDNQDRPALAISFKYDVKNGEVRSEVARRALALLLAMQDLPWATRSRRPRRHSSHATDPADAPLKKLGAIG